MLGAVGGGSWYAFRGRNLIVDPAAPMLALIASYTVATLFTYIREEKQRRFIHGAFDRYLSPELVKRIADDPGRLELGGEVRDMTVLFCDIRGFTRHSETMGPQEVIRFLVDFLTPMTDLLLARRATIDKYIGDAILAFWNAPLDDPDQHRNAARAALAMVARLAETNRDMPMQQPDAWPTNVKIGIGLNAGLCCVGNMGSAQRLTYSLIGDTVNLASRIEALTKFYGVTIALGGALHDRLEGFATLEIDRVRVLGRDQPETLYTLLGDEALAVTPDFLAFSQAHAALLTAYRAQQWAAARQALGQLERSAPAYGLERLHALYRERVAEFDQHPPQAGWDGVFTATEKAG